jgi:8-oxo-dGTP pyrophosphatase MutT (NUDIX family)
MPLIHQAGSIVVRLDRKEPQVLLVTAKRNPKNWIFPKGHIEKGEPPKPQPYGRRGRKPASSGR